MSLLKADPSLTIPNRHPLESLHAHSTSSIAQFLSHHWIIPRKKENGSHLALSTQRLDLGQISFSQTQNAVITMKNVSVWKITVHMRVISKQERVRRSWLINTSKNSTEDVQKITLGEKSWLTSSHMCLYITMIRLYKIVHVVIVEIVMTSSRSRPDRRNFREISSPRIFDGRGKNFLRL